MFTKLHNFKAKVEGSSLNVTKAPGKKFEIKLTTTLDDFIKKEINHVYALNQLLNSMKFHAQTSANTESTRMTAGFEELVKLTNTFDPESPDKTIENLNSHVKGLVD